MQSGNMYLVVQKVWTSAELDGRTEARNFYLFQYEHGREAGVRRVRRSWLAVRAMEATCWREAYARSSQDLIKLADALHVVLQCVFSLAGASWFVWRQYHEGSGIVIASLSRPQQVVGIGLWRDQQKRDVERLRAVNGAALLYFRESGRASTAKTKLAMLVIAAEAMAGGEGKSSKCNKCQEALVCPKCGTPNSYRATDADNVKRILGPEIYKALYRGPENLRNRLMHGNLIDES
jgi:hypothetical protein